MPHFLFFLILIFVIINIVQTWLILNCKLLVRGGFTIGALEVLELPLIIYLFLKDGLIVFFIVVVTEMAQWLSIAYLATKR